jgi:acid phosphatase
MMFTPMDVELAGKDPGETRTGYADSTTAKPLRWSRRGIMVMLGIGLAVVVTAGVFVGISMGQPSSQSELQAIDVFVFGDWGRRGVPEQLAVAAAMKAMKTSQLSGIVSTGDQFYERGVSAATAAQDEQWSSSWHDIYYNPGSPLSGVPFVGSLGNHDLLESVDAQTQHAAGVAVPDEWYMPARYFEWSACIPGSPGAGVQAGGHLLGRKSSQTQLQGALKATGTSTRQGCLCIAVVDTTCLLASMRNETAPGSAGRKRNCRTLDRPAMVRWLNDTLSSFQALQCAKSLVVGHHPIISGGEHGDNPEVAQALLPAMAGRADAYISGHDHMQQISTIPGVFRPIQIVSGAGSTVRNDTVATPTSLFTSIVPGLLRLRLEANPSRGWDGRNMKLDCTIHETPVGGQVPSPDASGSFSITV